MRLKADQIHAALAKKLAPLYLICGDEPMQSGETADAIRLAARQAGYLNREILSVDAQFSWAELAVAANSLSLFDDKKIIDLRLPSGKPGAEGSKALIEYCQRISEDNLLLISSAKIAAASQKSRWFQALDKVGVIIQVWPQEGKDLIQWLQRRLLKKGMQLDQQGLNILASQTEGNLLAAAQEIEKLYVLYGAGVINSGTVAEVVVDNSRYDVFKLVDSLLSGRIERMTRILRALKAEGVAEPVVLWALTREARSLRTIMEMLAHGQSRDSALRKNNVWDKRKNLVNAALNRLQIKDLDQVMLLAAKADRQIKGEQPGDAWETLLQICLVFSGTALIS